jgi:hypothetical protein
MHEQHTHERVEAFYASQVSADSRYPIWELVYFGGRGTRRRSECKFNDAPAAIRFGRMIHGAPMR